MKKRKANVFLVLEHSVGCYDKEHNVVIVSRLLARLRNFRATASVCAAQSDYRRRRRRCKRWFRENVSFVRRIRTYVCVSCHTFRS